MQNEVAVMDSREVAISAEQKELIKKTICKDATDAEMQLFFFDCQRRGTHPLDKLLHFTKRDGRYTPVTSIDFFRLRAHSSGAYAGEGATTYELGEDGLPNTCTVAVLRLVQGQLCTWRATARWDEYYPGEKSGFIWKKMPFLMLAKCAEALALRKAFPAELQGLYVKEEMDQAVVDHKPLPKGAEMLAKIEAKETVQGDGLGTLSGATDAVREDRGCTPVSQDAPASPFFLTNAVADYSVLIHDGVHREDLQALWDTIVKDTNLSTQERTELYGRYQRRVKSLKGK